MVHELLILTLVDVLSEKSDNGKSSIGNLLILLSELHHRSLLLILDVLLNEHLKQITHILKDFISIVYKKIAVGIDDQYQRIHHLVVFDLTD